MSFLLCLWWICCWRATCSAPVLYVCILSLAARPIRHPRLNNLWTEVCGDVWLYRSREDVQILPHSVLCQLLCSWQKSSTEGHHHCPKSNWLPHLSLRDIANIRHLSRGQNVVKDCSHLRDRLFDLLRSGRCYRLLKTDLQTHKHFLPETVHSHHTRWAVTVHTQYVYMLFIMLYVAKTVTFAKSVDAGTLLIAVFYVVCMWFFAMCLMLKCFYLSSHFMVCLM